MGIIPADAGSTKTLTWASWPPKDHPRRCGEHRSERGLWLARHGSSPQMRGAPHLGADETIRPGIIPADAGSTWNRRRSRTLNQDHPRRCGEHTTPLISDPVAVGSSPQMRGAQPLLVLYALPARIIPADAGSTLFFIMSGYDSRDHPRRCGEHQERQQRWQFRRGSSPQMRGAPKFGIEGLNQTRIIPADAGSTNIRQLGDMGYRDHPRRCGEHCPVSPSAALFSGSSPQMRGAPSSSLLICLPPGIIPADAGSTARAYGRPTAPKDHPRRCGEHRICSS